MTGARRVAAVAALALAVVGRAQAAPPPSPNLPEALLVAKAALDENGFFLKDGPEPAAALEAQWVAVRGWAADWLRSRPTAPPAAAAVALKAATGFDVSAVRLDARSQLFAVTDDPLGDAFILRRGENGRVTTAWAIEAPGAAEAGAFPLVEAWSPSRASDSCGAHRPSTAAARCGPLTAEVAVLRPEADGAARFVLHGVYAQEMGATGGQLVSVWRWDGARAEPLLARTFTFMADQAQPLVDVRGSGLRVGGKDDWRQIFACGACDGRQARTDVVLPAKGAAWGPTVSLTPELDAVDALYDAVVHGRATGGLADPAAAAVVRTQVAALRSASPVKPGESIDWTLGMLGAYRLDAQGSRRSLCLETDNGGSQRFTLARVGGAWRILAVTSATEGACEGKGAKS